MTSPTNPSWAALLDGDGAPEAFAAALGLTPQQAQALRDYHQAAAALARARRRRLARRVAVTGVAVALAVVGWSAAPAWAQASCAQTLPAPLVTFCPDAPARADQVNANFQGLATVITTKTGALTSADVNVQTGIVSFGGSARQLVELPGAIGGLGFQSNVLYTRSPGSFAWYSGGVHDNTPLSAGAGGTRTMSLNAAGDLQVRGQLTAGSIRVPHSGDSPFASGADLSPEVYQLTTPPAGVTCNAANRGLVFVARPQAQSDQDSLCFCGLQTSTYEIWCFNP